MVRYHNSGTQKFDDTEHESVNTGEISNVYVADADAADMGAEIQSVHDNKCGTGDAIFIPPGEYDQNTAIHLSKGVTLYSTGDWYNPGAILNKTGDFDQLRLTVIDRESGGKGDASNSVVGIQLNAKGQADTSRGLLVQSVCVLDVHVRYHGDHGVHFLTDDADSNNQTTLFSRGYIFTEYNDGDGYRCESTAGDTSLNAMKLGILAEYNTGDGVNHIDGYGNTYWIISELNDGRGVNLEHSDHQATVYLEGNGAQSTAPASRTKIRSLSSDLSLWDTSSFHFTTSIQQGANETPRSRIDDPSGFPKLQFVQDGATKGSVEHLNNDSLQVKSQEGDISLVTEDENGNNVDGPFLWGSSTRAGQWDHNSQKVRRIGNGLGGFSSGFTVDGINDTDPATSGAVAWVEITLPDGSDGYLPVQQ